MLLIWFSWIANISKFFSSKINLGKSLRLFWFIVNLLRLVNLAILYGSYSSEFKLKYRVSRLVRSPMLSGNLVRFFLLRFNCFKFNRLPQSEMPAAFISPCFNFYSYASFSSPSTPLIITSDLESTGWVSPSLSGITAKFLLILLPGST